MSPILPCSDPGRALSIQELDGFRFECTPTAYMNVRVASVVLDQGKAQRSAAPGMSHAISACVLLAVFTYCSCMSRILFRTFVTRRVHRSVLRIPLHNRTSMVESTSKGRRVLVSHSAALFFTMQATQVPYRSSCPAIAMHTFVK
jgi:hypothetical protein